MCNTVLMNYIFPQENPVNSSILNPSQSVGGAESSDLQSDDRTIQEGTTHYTGPPGGSTSNEASQCVNHEEEENTKDTSSLLSKPECEC